MSCNRSHSTLALIKRSALAVDHQHIDPWENSRKRGARSADWRRKTLTFKN